MYKYVCSICSYIYNPYHGDKKGGVSPTTSFLQLPKDWNCPNCGMGKDTFEKYVTHR